MHADNYLVTWRTCRGLAASAERLRARAITPEDLHSTPTTNPDTKARIAGRARTRSSGAREPVIRIRGGGAEESHRSETGSLGRRTGGRRTGGRDSGLESWRGDEEASHARDRRRGCWKRRSRPFCRGHVMPEVGGGWPGELRLGNAMFSFFFFFSKGMEE